MLQVQPTGSVPDETARIAHQTFPKGNRYLKLRDGLGSIYSDRHFSALFPTHGQPAQCPWRLALVSVMQFVEDLSDRQAAEAVKGPCIELEKFWPLSLKSFHRSAFEFEYLCLVLIGCMQRKRLKVLKTRLLWSIKNP